MDAKELKKLVAKGEDSRTEFKESYSPEIGKEICAFANADGGRILLGVTDKKEIKGIDATNRLKSQIHDLTRNFDPKLDVSIDETGNILIIEVPNGKNKPYSANGKFFVRKGTNSQQLNRDEIRAFFQMEGLVSFDETPNKDFDLRNDFSEEAFNVFVEKAKISSGLSKQQILSNTELVKDGFLKNAGVLLFSKKISKFFINATIVCVLFQGQDKVKILDKAEFDTGIFHNYENAISYLKSKLNVEYIIRTLGPREEKLELPEPALREALLNAICHRNYFIETPIFVEIFSDRVEITNAGGLLPGMTLSDLGKKSLSRNKLLFSLMQRTSLVEKAGTGILRIRSAMKEYRLPQPKIIADNDWFNIIFKRPNLQKESYEQRFYKGSQKSSQKSSQKILEAIQKDSFVTIEQLAKTLGISDRAIKKNLAKLKKSGAIKRVGPDKGGHWKAINAGNNKAKSNSNNSKEKPKHSQSH